MIYPDFVTGFPHFFPHEFPDFPRPFFHNDSMTVHDLSDSFMCSELRLPGSWVSAGI